MTWAGASFGDCDGMAADVAGCVGAGAAAGGGKALSVIILGVVLIILVGRLPGAGLLRLWRRRKLASALAIGSSSFSGSDTACETGRDVPVLDVNGACWATGCGMGCGTGCEGAAMGAGDMPRAGPGCGCCCCCGCWCWCCCIDAVEGESGAAPGANMLLRLDVEGGGVRADGEMACGGGVRFIVAR